MKSLLPPPQQAGAGAAAGAAVAHKIFVCGPPSMVKALSGEKKSPADQGELTGMLAKLGYAPAQVYKY